MGFSSLLFSSLLFPSLLFSSLLFSSLLSSALLFSSLLFSPLLFSSLLFSLSLSLSLFHGEREGQDPGQGGHPPGPAEVDLRWQAAGGRKNPLRLQHPEGVHPPSCSPSQGRYADLREDPHREDHHPGGRALRHH